MRAVDPERKGAGSGANKQHFVTVACMLGLWPMRKWDKWPVAVTVLLRSFVGHMALQPFLALLSAASGNAL